LKITVDDWYGACTEAAAVIETKIPEVYRSRTFSGIIGDIKALSPKKAQSLIARKKGLGHQYAWLYLTRGIDHGQGYQACASEALGFVLGGKKDEIFGGRILDVGCAVGVTAGILSLPRVTGFDLFPDLLRAAKLIDSITGARHDYVTADMTANWPFACMFETVVCGLVCHHLKRKPDILTFFSNANRVLRTGGFLVITLPSGSITFVSQLENLIRELETFGFYPENELSGVVLSTDHPHSLFWMFTLVFKKIGTVDESAVMPPEIDFAEFRTPVSREEKGIQARSSASKNRQVRHQLFRFLNLPAFKRNCGEKTLIFETMNGLRKESCK